MSFDVSIVIIRVAPDLNLLEPLIRYFSWPNHEAYTTRRQPVPKPLRNRQRELLLQFVSAFLIQYLPSSRSFNGADSVDLIGQITPPFHQLCSRPLSLVRRPYAKDL